MPKPITALNRENQRQYTRGLNDLRIASAINDGEIVSTPIGPFTFKTSPSAAGQVAIGANIAAALANLAAAINAIPGSGVVATVISGNEMLFEDVDGTVPGVQGNASAGAVLTSTANYAAGEYFMVGGVTYTFVAILTDANINEILLGATEAASIQNATDAVNGNIHQVGSTISLSQKPNPKVTAVAGAHTVTFTARAMGSYGNTLVTTENCANASFAGATMSGGTDIPQFTSTMTGANNQWAMANFYGVSAQPTENYVRTISLVSRVPNAQEIALKSMHFLMGFTVRSFMVMILDSTGKPKAYDGTIVVVGRRVTLTNAAGAVNLAANDVVSVLASE